MGNKDIVVLINGVPLPKDDFEKVVAFISNLSKETSKEYQVWLEEIYENGFALKYVPEDMRTYELCERAVKDEARALQYVPEELRTFELCDKAIFTILRDEWDVDLDESFEGFFERNVPEEFQEELAEKYDIELPEKSKGILQEI